MSTSIRRDTVRKLAEAGKLIAVSSYHYDEMSGQTGIDKEMPVRISKGYGDFVEGQINLIPSDFTSSCGYAHLDADGKTIHLGVHGNCNYTFRVKDGEAMKQKAPSKAKRPEHARMQAWLKEHGIEASVKYFRDGSMRGCWSFYNGAVNWSLELAEKLNGLGFLDYDHKPLGTFSGNGGVFSVFVTGHDEILTA